MIRSWGIGWLALLLVASGAMIGLTLLVFNRCVGRVDEGRLDRHEGVGTIPAALGGGPTAARPSSPRRGRPHRRDGRP